MPAVRSRQGRWDPFPTSFVLGSNLDQPKREQDGLQFVLAALK